VIDLGESYDLMFDAVINHISVRSEWFERFLRDEQPYRDFFITVDEGVDLSEVFRPRALPLLTEFQTAVGPKKVWTTFSADQVDLNYHHPEVLLEIVRILLMFVERGARFIRLDAIAYIWKEQGTSCLHHQKAHRIIQFFRLIFNELAPYVQMITETNVPHQENISYFGDGANEAQLVYNFSLPPLVLHAFHQQNALILSRWAKTLVLPSKQTSFFNFLASHDGIGVTPAKGLIPEEEIEQLCERVKRLGGFVSYKDNPDGTRSPYELNINYLDALGDPAKEDEPISLVSDRFLASQSIMLALKGVPGIYYHSLLGSRSWNEGVRQTGRNRTINREKLDIDSLLEALHEEGSLRHLVFNGLMTMLRSRAFNADGAFSPYGEQSILDVNDKLMVILRSAQNQTSRVLCLCNVSAEKIELIPQDQPLGDLNWQNQKVIYARNASLLLGRAQEKVLIGPYGILWILFRRGN
jgi:sucrose phosphorylase